jgi:hypothetical protein
MQVSIEATDFQYMYLLHVKQALYHLSYAHCTHCRAICDNMWQ